MSPRRLSDADKKQIVERYRLPAETTSTLATQFGVSNSTISRVLKNTLSTDEYEALVQQKRGRTAAESSEPASVVTREPAETDETESPRRSRQRSSATPRPKPKKKETPKPQSKVAAETDDEDETETVEPSSGQSAKDDMVIQEILNEEFLHHHRDPVGEDSFDDLDDEDDDDFGDDEDDFGDDEDEQPQRDRLTADSWIQILPLTDVAFPKTCYLVVDRSAELVTRPLEDFADLGRIPSEETQEKTLPVFDNHRVARRFSNPRTQRVIKLPDSSVLEKTWPHLQAKGITRLLIDGQVYALVNGEDDAGED